MMEEVSKGTHLLRIDASGRHGESVSRRLLDHFVAHLRLQAPGSSIVVRDLAAVPLPHVDDVWIPARLVPPAERSNHEADSLALSDVLIAELIAAETIIVGLPIYNFAVPASFKAWIDLVCRPGATFRRGTSRPEGMLTGKRAIVVFVSGGTVMGGPVDYASDWVRHIFGFIGIDDVVFVAADVLGSDGGDAKISAAQARLGSLASDFVRQKR